MTFTVPKWCVIKVLARVHEREGLSVTLCSPSHFQSSSVHMFKILKQWRHFAELSKYLNYLHSVCLSKSCCSFVGAIHCSLPRCWRWKLEAAGMMMCLQGDHCELTGATKQEQIRQICQTDFKLCNVASTWNPFEWMQMSFVRCEEPVHWIMNESAPPKAQQWKGTKFSDWTQEACIMYHSGPVRWNAVCDLVSRLSVHLHLSHYALFSLAHFCFSLSKV